MENQPRVKIRVSVAGNRYIGYVILPEGPDRMSDLLNNSKLFLKIQNPSSYEPVQENSEFIINKEYIDYVQVLDETPIVMAKRIPGSFHKMRVKTTSIEIMGELFVPETGALPMDVVNDDRLFLSIKDADIVNTPEKYSFLAISKRRICTVEVYQS
ncbi:MAG: hypothetical protein ABFR82_14085 [Nitrospirota bacterium]